MMLVEDLRAQLARGELAIDRLLALVPVIAADPDPKVARSAVDAAALPMAGLDDAMYLAARAWLHAAFAARARRETRDLALAFVAAHLAPRLHSPPAAAPPLR